MSDSEDVEAVLEESTRWWRVVFPRSEKTSLTKINEMDKWCRGCFASDTYFRFGNSYFFMNNEDKVLFQMTWR